MVNLIRVPRERFQREVDDNLVEGWRMKRKNDDVVILKRRHGRGSLMTHVVIFIFTAWFTIFLGNFIYALYSHYINQDELEIKVE
jgi:hypothetical protein